MATKAELQAALNQARDEIKVLKCQLNTAEAERWAINEMLIEAQTQVVAPKSIPVPKSLSRREVMAAAKAQAIATGRTVLAA